MNFAVVPLVQPSRLPDACPHRDRPEAHRDEDPYFFSLLQQPDKMMGALADYMKAKRAKTVAVVYTG